ncbi:MAG: DUF6232 family protein [Blautia sp.]|nr:DUF6232 family protein [Blautia sp.]
MQQPKINIVNIGNSQREEFYTMELKIAKNVFIFNETVIPLCNISRINIVEGAKTPYSIIHFVMILIGIVALFSGEPYGAAIGITLVFLGGWLVYRVYEANQRKEEFLVLGLNSGRDVYLRSNDHEFTIEVMDVIINCLNSGKEYTVNMAHCKIEKCQFGEGNILQDKEAK